MLVVDWGSIMARTLWTVRHRHHRPANRLDARRERRKPCGKFVPRNRFFFWSGNGLPKTYVANWQRAYRRLFSVADLRKPDGTPKRCHCHMFRDTFAVEMLLAGVPIDQVSILLGHSSVRVTEKHYSPWVRARQDQLEKSVQSAWQLLPEHKAVAS